jgi:hypothetical protein
MKEPAAWESSSPGSHSKDSAVSSHCVRKAAVLAVAVSARRERLTGESGAKSVGHHCANLASVK